MFALGQERTLRQLRPMSALPPKADKLAINYNVISAIAVISETRLVRTTPVSQAR